MKRLPLVFFLSLILSPFMSYALSLQEGLKIVTESGRDVQIARSDEDIARASVSLARSPWLPSVDLYGRETWLRYQPESKLPFSIPGASTNSIPVSQDQFLTYGVRATQLLYDFGKTSSSIDAAKYGLKARETGDKRHGRERGRAPAARDVVSGLGDGANFPGRGVPGRSPGVLGFCQGHSQLQCGDRGVFDDASGPVRGDVGI